MLNFLKKNKETAEVLLKTEINREKGFLYFLKGNPLILCRTKAGRKKQNEN